MRWLLLALLLAGCGTIDAHEAADPFGSASLIGANIADLIGCAGNDFSFVQTDAHEGVVQYTTANQDKGFSLSLLGLAIDFGGSGACKMALTVIDDGTVARITFPQSHVAGIAPPLAPCGPLISECLRDRATTSRATPYDAFKWLREKQAANIAKATSGP